jgi:hypothetical protein
VYGEDDVHDSDSEMSYGSVALYDKNEDAVEWG